MAVSRLTLLNGAKMPMVGLGTWTIPPNVVTKVVMTAIDSGYRHIDCAADYENEAGVGDGLKTKLDEGKIKREDIFITSKLWLTHFAPDRVRGALLESLKKLKLEFLDLYLMHFPFAMKDSSSVENPNDYDSLSDESIDYVDTWKALIQLQREGLAKAIGVSNFNQYQIERLCKETSHKSDVHQFECHPYLDQTDLVRFCQGKSIIVTGYSPLSSPGNRSHCDPDLFREPLMQEIANKHKKSVAQIALRYQIQRRVAVIPKSVNDARILSNIDIFGFELSEEEMTKIKGLNQEYRTCDVDGWASRSHKYYPFRKNYKE